MVSIAIDSRTGEKNWCPTVSNVDEVNPDRVTKVFDESEAHQAKLDERKHECNLSDIEWDAEDLQTLRHDWGWEPEDGEEN